VGAETERDEQGMQVEGCRASHRAPTEAGAEAWAVTVRAPDVHREGWQSGDHGEGQQGEGCRACEGRPEEAGVPYGRETREEERGQGTTL